MSWNTVRCALFTLGAILIAWAEYAINNLERADLPTLAEHLGRLGDRLLTIFPQLFPPGIGIALAVLLLGALLAAVALGVPGERVQAGTEATPAPGIAMVLPRSTRYLLALACILAALSALCSGVAALQPGAVALWVATFLCGWMATLLADRARGTRLGNPMPERWEWLSLLLLVVLDMYLVVHDLTHWRWAGIPDESNFFQVAKSIAIGNSDRFLLSEHGVFNYHPVLSSFYQSVFMRLLGVNIFAWRLSSAVALAGSLPFLYLLTRQLWNRGAAFAAAIFFGSTQLAVGFAHFGYNNVQAYPVVLGSLGLFAWAQRQRSLLGYYLAGCIAGLGFYTFQPAMLAPVLVVILGMNLGALPLRAGDRRLTGAFVLGVVFTVLPACVHLPQTIAHVVQQTSMTATGSELRIPELGKYVNEYLRSGTGRLLQHWVWSIVYGFWFIRPHHFQTNPIVDPVCGGLAAVGLWLCAGALRRQVNARFLLPVYLLCALLVGATSQHERPPLTRLLFLSPFIAMLAAAALDQFVRRLGHLTAGRTTAAISVGAVLVTASTVWSVTQLHNSIYHTFHGYGDGTTSELIRIAQQLPSDTKLVYVQEEPTGMPEVDFVLEEYGMSERFTYLHSTDAQRSDITPRLLQQSPPVVVFTNLTRPAELRSIEHALAERFPAATWHASDPQAPWNVRYCYVPQGVAAARAAGGESPPANRDQ